MALEKIDHVSGTAVHVPGEDIDTDRIIPARFMRCVTFDGLGEYLFYDVRFDANGRKLGHPLDRPEHQGATILLSGSNFGCGSSREHAPQAIKRFGIRAIIAGSFAEIFFDNCTKLGIPCVSLQKGDLACLARTIETHPQTPVMVDLKEKTVRFGEGRVPLTIKEAARTALMTGQWDVIAQLLEGKELVQRLLG